MTIVIPYKDEVHKGIELKYALRSIEKYLSGWDDLWVIGDAPLWYTGNRLFIQDYAGKREFSVYNKLLKACDLVEDDFIYWNDDHFLLKPLHVSEIKYWHNGSLKDDMDKSGSARNRLSKQNTIELLEKRGATWLNYDIHVPIVFNKTDFKNIFKDLQQEVVIKSLYANSWEPLPGSEFMEDCKISGDFTEDYILDRIKDRLFFSSGTMLSGAMINILEKLFPEPSKFE